MWSGELGFSPESFWDQTPRTLAAIIEGKVESMKREHEGRALLAWNIERLRREKRPKFSDLLPKPPPRKQTEAEMIASMKAIFASRKAAHG